MNRKEFGQLVAALRKEHLDEDGNLWTQEKLGKETGLGTLIIGKIERGGRLNLNEDTLLKLATALQLTSMERKEFFLASTGIDSKYIVRENTTPHVGLADLLQMMEGLQLPAYIDDSYADIIAANSAIIHFLGIGSDLIQIFASHPAGANSMRIIFAPEFGFCDMAGDQWDIMAVRNMQFFRYTTLRYRATKYFIRSLKELRKIKSFKKYWTEAHFEENDDYSQVERYEYNHPTFGSVSYLATMSLTVTSFDDLYLIIYNPADRKTAQVFADIVEKVGTKVHRFASWPKKEFES